MSTLRELRELAMAGLANKAAQQTSNSNGAAIPQHQQNFGFLQCSIAAGDTPMTVADLPSFSELLSLNQVEIDAIESEIHALQQQQTDAITNTMPIDGDNDNANTTTTNTIVPTASSTLLQAYLRLVAVYQHMANEATRVVKETGVMSECVVAAADSSSSTSSNPDEVESSDEDDNDDVASTDNNSQVSSAKKQQNDDDDFDVDFDSTASVYGGSTVAATESDETSSPVDKNAGLSVDVASNNIRSEDTCKEASPTTAAESESSNAITNNNKSKRRITFISSQDASPAKPEEEGATVTNNSESIIADSTTVVKQSVSKDSEGTKKKSNKKLVTSGVSLPSTPIPPLLTEAYNSLNVVFERAIRGMGALNNACSSSDGAVSTATGVAPNGIVSASALLSLLLRKTTSSSSSPAASVTTSSSASYKLWRMYIQARTAQALMLRLPLKRVLYPLFERALATSNSSNSNSNNHSANDNPLCGVALRLWLDYCDLALFLRDFTKLRLVLQQAFEALPSSGHHTRLWQYVRQRVFGLSGGAAASSMKKKSHDGGESNGNAISKKALQESIIFSCVQKYNDGLPSSTLMNEENASGEDAEGEEVKTTTQRKRQQKQQQHRHPLAIPLTLPSASASVAASFSSSASSVDVIPSAVLQAFWREYVLAFPTQRTRTEYLAFLSHSVYTAVEIFNIHVKAREERTLMKKQQTKKTKSNNSVHSGLNADAVEYCALVDAAAQQLLSAAQLYMNFVVEHGLGNKSSSPLASSSVATASSSLLVDAPTASHIGVSITVETWETIAFVMQNILVASSASLASSSSTQTSTTSSPSTLSQKDVRRWVEAIVSGLERSVFENSKSYKRAVEGSTATNSSKNNAQTTASSSSSSTTAAAAAAVTTIAPVHLKAKVEIFFACAVALCHFALFDEAYELLWDYVVKAKGAFGSIAVFQKVFAFVCAMLQSVAGHALTTVEVNAENKHNDHQHASVQSLEKISSTAQKALERLQHIAGSGAGGGAATAGEYDRIRLDIVLRNDKKNVAAWQERIMLYRDAFEEQSQSDASSTSSSKTTLEMVKRVYLQAIQALSTVVSSSVSSVSSSSANKGMDELFAAEAKSSFSANEALSEDSSGSSPTDLTADALSAVIAIYEEYVAFIYHYEKDYEGLKAFLRRSILYADFGNGGGDGDDDSDDDDEDDNSSDDDNGGPLIGQKRLRSSSSSANPLTLLGGGGGDNESQQRGLLRGAKGINVNVRLFGMLLDITLKEQGPAAAKALLLSWVNECPLTSSCSSTSGGGGAAGASTCISSVSALAAVDKKKAERDYYRSLAKGTLKKQRRVELFGSASSGAVWSANHNKKSNTTASAGGSALSSTVRISTQLWLSEQMWDTCLYFAALCDKQIELFASASGSGNAKTTTSSLPSVNGSANHNNNDNNNNSNANDAASHVWRRCVLSGMASPWLTMRLVDRLVSAAGATALPTHILGRKENESEKKSKSELAAKTAFSAIVVPNSIFNTDWASLEVLKDKYNSISSSSSSAASSSNASSFSSSFQIFPIDPTAPTKTLLKQLTATRDALAALVASLNVLLSNADQNTNTANSNTVADPIPAAVSIATLTLWRVNLMSEEARLLEAVAAVQQHNSSRNGISGGEEGVSNTSGNVKDVSIVRECVRSHIVAALTTIAAMIAPSALNSAPSAASASLSAALAQLLLRYIWFEGQQVPFSTVAKTGQQQQSNQKKDEQHHHLSHNIEAFPAYGTCWMPLLICPTTLQCALVRRATSPSPSSESITDVVGVNLPPFFTLLASDHDRLRVLDTCLKTIVATRGVDFAQSIIQKNLGMATSAIDVAFLSVRLAACLVMKKDIAAARSIFDKVSPSQAQSVSKVVVTTTTSSAASSTEDSSSSASLLPAAAMVQFRAFWASWYGMEAVHGSPSTVKAFSVWHSKVAKVLGPVGVAGQRN